MTSNSKYEVYTYQCLLRTLSEIEETEKKLRKKKADWIVLGGFLGLFCVAGIILFKFFTPYIKLNFFETITSYGSAISLGPVFGYLYYNTQAEMLSNQKIQFWQSLKKLFGTDPILFDNKSTDAVLNIDEIKKILLEKLKEKLNENIKYEH